MSPGSPESLGSFLVFLFSLFPLHHAHFASCCFPSSRLYDLCQFPVTLLRIDFAPRSLALTIFHSTSALQAYLLPARKIFCAEHHADLKSTDDLPSLETIHSQPTNLETKCSPSFLSASSWLWPPLRKLLLRDMDTGVMEEDTVPKASSILPCTSLNTTQPQSQAHPPALLQCPPLSCPELELHRSQLSALAGLQHPFLLQFL